MARPVRAEKTLRALRELKRVYGEIDRLVDSLSGAKKRRAQEIRARIWAGEIDPWSALKEIRRLARS